MDDVGEGSDGDNDSGSSASGSDDGSSISSGSEVGGSDMSSEVTEETSKEAQQERLSSFLEYNIL